ncbi:hypothetical protein [Pseudarthrobacter sp. SSS035]|uniref:hypothetical protein n=1 Tax=Pseudarthrobacter sp. SSS035 TaxID=2931399 RepID=UPI00200BDAA4|nr:hypothetical protein [Pseudarthrobacter sp. SSS035]
MGGTVETMKYTKPLATVVLIAAAAGLGLSACSSNNPNATAPTVTPVGGSASSAAAPAAAEPSKSARGNFIKAIGEPAGMFDSETKEATVNFTINAITVDAACTAQFAQPAENGHFVVLDVTAETTPALGNATVKSFDVSPVSFKFITAAGTTFNGSLWTGPSFLCLDDAETFPSAGMGPAEKVAAKVVLDVPETTGTLVFRDLFGSASWEWNF